MPSSVARENVMFDTDMGGSDVDDMLVFAYRDYTSGFRLACTAGLQ